MSIQNTQAVGYGYNVQLGNLLAQRRVSNPQAANETFNFNTTAQTGGFSPNHPNNKVDGLRCDAFDYLA